MSLFVEIFPQRYYYSNRQGILNEKKRNVTTKQIFRGECSKVQRIGSEHQMHISTNNFASVIDIRDKI